MSKVKTIRNEKGVTENDIKEISNLIESKGLTLKDFFNEVIDNDIEKFNTFIEWSSKDFKEYAILLDRASDIKVDEENGITTKKVGDILEELVSFIIGRTYFFEVIRNIRTRTNEIDLYITLSQKGLQALKEYNINRDLLIIPEDTLLGECKNYHSNIGSTWFGKFYCLMKTCDCNFGILFSLKRATGNFDNWSDSYGLIRTLTLIEKYEHGQDFYMIDFGLSDFKTINHNTNFFDIIKNKIIALKTGTNYDLLIKKLKKDFDDEKIKIAENFNKIK